MQCTYTHTHTPSVLATLISDQSWLVDQVRGCRLTPGPSTPFPSPPAPPWPPIYTPHLIPGESIQLNGWLQTGGLGAGMFLWDCRAQFPLSTGEQLNHSSLITVKSALAPAPTTTQVQPPFLYLSLPHSPQKNHTWSFSHHKH